MRVFVISLWGTLCIVGCGSSGGQGNGNENHNANDNQVVALCGDGERTGAEECDDGTQNSDSRPDACRTDCTLPRCGDGVVDTAEACDEGPANSDVVPDACRRSCALPACGDGVVDVLSGERCDCGPPEGPAAEACAFPNGHPEGSCGATCQVYICGNGVLDPGEVCDDGNTVSGDGCSANCLSDETCGNGVVDAATEDCDDGGLVNHDGCHSRCAAERPRWQKWPLFTPGRASHSMAFHAGIGRLVLFGGEASAATWELHGAAWAFAETPQTPLGRAATAMTFDEGRGRLVLFGGFFGQSLFGDTWEYDGAQWFQVSTATAPESRAGHALVYDAARGRVLLFGGLSAEGARDDTWEYDGAAWSPLPSADHPSPRLNHRMAYDATRSRVVLFGGCAVLGVGGSCTGATLGDTWEHDGSGWTERLPALAPTPRSGHGMAWDASRGAVTLFGGRTGILTTQNDLWVWNGSTWAPLSAPGGPTARGGHAMAYDTQQGRLVVQGGCTQFRDGATPCQIPALTDTWALTGTTWMNLTASQVPAGRAYAAMATAGEGHLVLHGGFDGTGELSDTWELRSTHWVPGAPGGPQVAAHALAYDPLRDRLVLFGGCQDLAFNALNLCRTNHELDETWEYDGATWEQASPHQSPSPRYWHTMVFDPTRGKVILHGGARELSNLYADTWEYDGTTWTQIITPTNPTAVLMPSLVWDAARGVAVRLGGVGVSLSFEAWELDSQDWTERSFAIEPALRLGQVAVFDPHRAVTLLYGGCTRMELQGFLWLDCPVSLDDTWVYDGLGWQPQAVSLWPESRLGAAGAYDPASRGVFLHGGYSSYYGIFGDTWRHRLKSTFPDERCDNGVDDDGDGLVDCQDPDCEGRRCHAGTCQGGACL